MASIAQKPGQFNPNLPGRMDGAGCRWQTGVAGRLSTAGAFRSESAGRMDEQLP
ncbi:MAG: hypothetical protein IKK08_09240 [Clostridia bacterium]|nr:hypothetical protein [Clostridia bacterium]